MNKQLQSDRQSSASVRNDRAITEQQSANLQGKSQAMSPIDCARLLQKDLIFATLNLADLQAGKSFLGIEHYYTRADRHKSYYSTSITNRSTEKLRIDRFGTYTPNGKILVLHSITGGFFGSQQFQEWYDLGTSDWIEPGQVVIDPNNHSNLGVHWAYFGTTASGKQFVASAQWLGSKPWWQLW